MSWKFCKRKVCGKPFLPEANRIKRVYCCRLCKIKDANERYRRNNREKCLANARKFDRLRGHRKESYRIKHAYGITAAARDQIFRDQGEKCAVEGCLTQSVRSNGSRTQWNIDHCHTSGRVRGILCWRCNAALGLMKENPAILRGMIAYVERTKDVDLRTKYPDLKHHPA